MTSSPTSASAEPPLAAPRLTRNTVANFVAMVWSAFLNLAFVPVYIRLLGVESWGLVALFTTIQAGLALLDFGLSPTMSREMARSTGSPEMASEARDLARTLEVGYWAIAGAIAVAIIPVAPVLAKHWVHSNTLSLGAVTGALVVMGITAACQWPLSFYAGGMRGLQEQVLLNTINITMATARYGGAALIVWKVAPTVIAFFVWQAAASALHTGLLLAFFWKSMPSRRARPQVRVAMVRRVWRFAAGMSAISVTSLVMMQADKIVVSGMLSLEEFGYYSIASLLAQSLASLAVPISTAVLPRFTQLASIGDWGGVQRLYHRASQAMTIVIASVGLVLVFFAREFLAIWTRSSMTADRAHSAVSLLVIGSMLSSLQSIPYVLLLANGLTRPPLVISGVVAAAAFPILFLFVRVWGGAGACIAWILFNAFTIGPIANAVHSRMLRKDQARWYVEDTFLPLLGAAVPVLAVRLLIPPDVSSRGLAAVILGTTAAAIAGGIAAASEIRPLMLCYVRRRIHAPGA